MSDKTLGQINYEAWAAEQLLRTPVSGPIWTWNDQSEKDRECMEIGSQAVANHVSVPLSKRIEELEAEVAAYRYRLETRQRFDARSDG